MKAGFRAAPRSISRGSLRTTHLLKPSFSSFTSSRPFHATGIGRKSPWDVLGIAETADDAEIKEAYKTMSKKYHPDISKEKDAPEKFTEIVKAYNILKDPKKREQARSLSFEDFDYRGNADEGMQFDLRDFFRRDEMGINYMEVVRRLVANRKKKLNKVEQEQILQALTLEFLKKPKFSSANITKEFPEVSLVKESGAEYFLEPNRIELVNLTEDKMFVLGYLECSSRAIADRAVYSWQNRTSASIAEGSLEVAHPSSLSPKKIILRVSDEAGDQIGRIETTYLPYLPFFSWSNFYDRRDNHIGKMNRSHFFGSRSFFKDVPSAIRHLDQVNVNRNNNNDEKNKSGATSSSSSKVVRKIKPFFFKEYRVDYQNRSLHPAFVTFATLIGYQLDISSFTFFSKVKGLIFRILKKIKVGTVTPEDLKEVQEEAEKEKAEKEKEKAKKEKANKTDDKAKNVKKEQTVPYGYSKYKK